MYLSEKERRVVSSPLTFSAKMRKTTRYRTKIKIQEMLQDVKFIIENSHSIKEDFGIDIAQYFVIPDEAKVPAGKEETQTSGKKRPSNNGYSDDPDLI